MKENGIDFTNVGIVKSVLYWLLTGIISTMNYIDVSLNLAIALAVAMGFDTLTGIFKAHALSEPITSKKGKRGIYEKVLTLSAVLLIGVLGKLLGIDLSWLVSSTLIILTIFESYSFLGNIGSIRTGKEMEELDAVSSVIKFLRRNLVGKLVDYLQEEPQKEKPEDEQKNNSKRRPRR